MLIKKIWTVFVCAVWVMLFTGNAISSQEDSSIKMACALRDGINYKGLPLLVEVSVSNCTDKVVNLVVYNGRPSSVRFKIQGEQVLRTPSYITGLSDEFQVPPKSSESFTYCVNRYVNIGDEEEFSLEYAVRLSYFEGDDLSSTLLASEITGEMEVKLNNCSRDKLEEFLRNETNRLEFGNLLTSVEVAESVCYIEDPVSLEYVGYVIESGDVVAQYMALDMLRRFNNQQSTDILVEYIDPSGKVHISKPIYKILIERDVVLSREKMDELLCSDNKGVLCNTLRYIVEMKLFDYFDLVRSSVISSDEDVEGLVREVELGFCNSNLIKNGNEESEKGEGSGLKIQD